MDKPKKFKLKIDKKALLLVDWANVYGWKKSLGWEVCPQRLYNFFDRPKVINKIFYYGEDEGQEKSENFMTEIKNIGFDISPKKVKWVPVLLENQSHFKKIVNNLFDILNIIKIRNSEISNNLYKLVSKIKKIEEDNNTNNREVEEIFESIEDIDYILDRLNIDIDDLEKTLKKKFLGGNVILMLR